MHSTSGEVERENNLKKTIKSKDAIAIIIKMANAFVLKPSLKELSISLFNFAMKYCVLIKRIDKINN